jgi:hypothetical protein
MSDNSFAGINFDDKESSQIFEMHKKTMCPRYKNLNESGFVVNLNVKNNNNNNSFVISGKLNYVPIEKRYIKYSAANPPTYNSNFSGSGLPYPTEEIAYDNTPNRGVVEIINGEFNFSIRYPNSYYINMGTIYIEPHVKLTIVDKDNNSIGEVKSINLGEGIPFRTLTWPVQRDWNKGPLFYKTNVDIVRTQYQILLDSAYPSKNVMPKNFWGMMPPH